MICGWFLVCGWWLGLGGFDVGMGGLVLVIGDIEVCIVIQDLAWIW